MAADFKKNPTLLLFISSLIQFTWCTTDPNDLAILNEFRKGLSNPELLDWPATGDDPCGSSWKYVYCLGSRVAQIQAKGLGLVGTLPSDFNQLSMLSNLGLQNNNLTGPLPSFSGLGNLKYAFLDNNNFVSIPGDFFDGLGSLQVLALDGNPGLNASEGGWAIPSSLGNSAQLQNLSLMDCNLVGEIPGFLGSMVSLQVLKLALNGFSGGFPVSFNGSNLQILWLNGQRGGGMTGSIDVITTMGSLTSVWLHGNQFSGTIPESIGGLSSLQQLDLNTNNMVGLVPASLASMNLNMLDLSNNHFMGPLPVFKSNASYVSNDFCQTVPGAPCAPEVTALLDFLGDLNYPSKLISSWSGNDPCGGSWLGLSCENNQVTLIAMSNFGLNGTLSPSIGNLSSLKKIILSNNSLTGTIPSNWTTLKSLVLLDVSGNDLSPPLPTFGQEVQLLTTNNPLFTTNHTSGIAPSSHGSSTPSPSRSSPSSPDGVPPMKGKSKLVVIVGSVASVGLLVLMLILLSLYCRKKSKGAFKVPGSLVIHPTDTSDSDNMVKIAVVNNTAATASVGSGSASYTSSGMAESHVIESGNLVISVQVLRKVTNDFAPVNELGRGGFGTVYKGELEDGMTIAVKRMEAGSISSKALNEFQSEIAVLSKVRHRNLVSLLGFSVEGNERLLVYEYMPQGALSKHLFHWKSFELEPLSWKKRLIIALDVARGMEYLHNLAHQSFIHRDLKPSNILLGEDFRAKVSDFGLVKLAPEGEKSVATRLAGTFGYLAPEYAVMGKITTKSDVFSFGVVLMELLTGLMALDEGRPEEKQYLAAWFWKIKVDKEKLLAAIDPALEVKEEITESIVAIAELAGHCTVREPNQRPDMSHAVNVLSPLVDKWKPYDDDSEEFAGIDYSLPLTQMVKGWQESEGKDTSVVDLEYSKDSIPARPAGFAESFTSADGR
ncbi:hypothetical protein Droror1_Dr00026567 [Drosera rotundifolia]